MIDSFSHGWHIPVLIVAVSIPVMKFLLDLYKHLTDRFEQKDKRIKILERELRGCKNIKLTQLIKERLECLKFQQLTGVYEVEKVLRNLFLDERHNLSCKEFFWVRLFCKVKKENFVGFNYFIYIFAWFSFLFLYYLLLSLLYRVLGDSYSNFYVSFVFIGLVYLSVVFFKLLIWAPALYSRNLRECVC